MEEGMRAKILMITFFIISISISIYAHKQHVHQYLTKEAYYQLRDYLGHDIPEMLAHLDNGCQGPLYSPPQVQFIPHLKNVNTVLKNS